MRRSVGLQAALCAALLVAASCSSSGDDDGTTAIGSGDETEAVAAGGAEDEPAPEYEAVPVEVETDAAAAAVATIGRNGGWLRATGADGSVFDLRVPVGALGADTEITMTPLTGLRGLPPATTLAFGVVLEPDGLTFAAPGWLYVSTDDEPGAIASGFGIDGDTATPRGIGYDGERYVLPVAHFSGAGGFGCAPNCGGPRGGGFGWPGGGDTPGPGSPGGGPIQPPGSGVPPWEPPGSPPGPFPGDDGSSGGGLPDHGSLVPPAGESGGGQPDGDLGARVGDVLQDLAEAQLRGDEEAEAKAEAELEPLKQEIKDAAWDAAAACINEKDLGKLRDLLHWISAAQLLGASEDAENEAFSEAIRSCNSFELDVIGNLEFRLGGDAFVVGDSIDVTVPLPMVDLGYMGEATGDVEPLGYDRGAEILELFAWGLGPLVGVDVPNNVERNDYISCDVSPKGQGHITAMAANMYFPDGPQVHLQLSEARKASVNCPDPIGSFPMEPWVMDMPFHIEAGFPGARDGGILFEGPWTKSGGGAPFATKDVHHEIDSEGAHLIFGWHLTINHAPGPLPQRPGA